MVQNAGPGNYSGPITVKDTLGVNAPATTIGPWACGQVGSVLTCNIAAPPVNVPPGWTSGFLVRAHVKKNVGPPLCDLDNKANISAPAGGSPSNLLPGNDFDSATTHIPDPACLLPQPHTDLEMKKAGLGCFATIYLGVNGYACQWKLTLTNVGPDAYSGPLSFRDTSAGATLNTLKTLAPAICTGPSTNVTCTLPGTVVLNPGVPVSLPFHTFYPGGPAVCSAINNLSILTPNPGSSPESGRQRFRLRLASRCPIRPAARRLHRSSTSRRRPRAAPPIRTVRTGSAMFEIKVSNLGGGVQPAPIKVTDYNDKPTTFTGAACAPSGPGQFLCTRPLPLNGGANWTFTATSRGRPERGDALPTAR